jgi:hypothetical protein
MSIETIRGLGYKLKVRETFRENVLLQDDEVSSSMAMLFRKFTWSISCIQVDWRGPDTYRNRWYYHEESYLEKICIQPKRLKLELKGVKEKLM